LRYFTRVSEFDIFEQMRQPLINHIMISLRPASPTAGVGLKTGLKWHYLSSILWCRMDSFSKIPLSAELA